MEKKVIEIAVEDARKIKVYVRETLKVVALFGQFLNDERIDENIRTEYGKKYTGD